MFVALKAIYIRCAARMLGAAVLAAALAAGGATSPASATSILFSSAAAGAQEIDVFSIGGTDFASEIAISTFNQDRASAIAQTGFRSNSATASASSNSTDSSRTTSASAVSRWTDNLTFTGGTGVGLITWVFSLSGNLTGDESSAGFTFVFDKNDVSSSGDVFNLQFLDPGTVSGFVVFYEILFDLDEALSDPLIFSAQLSVAAAVFSGATGTSSANFGATAILTQVIVPEGVVIGSGSGTDYTK